MKFYFQVVTTPTADTPGTCILLHFPDKRYFFGQISEGTQRACTERGVRLTALSDIFLTGRMGWQNTGGLIGVILTQADALASSAAALEKEAREKEARNEKDRNAKQGQGAQDDQTLAQRATLTIHGPRNLAHTLATARRFVFRKGMPVYTKEYDSEGMEKTSAETAGSTDPFKTPTWSDTNIKVWAMPIKPTSPVSFSPKPMSRTPSPKSPRKRSLDDFEEREQASSPFSDHEKNQIMRQSVITHMFNSTWRMDALTETPLAEVRQPAVMFVRNPETKDLERYTGPLPGGDEPVPDINVLVRQPWPGATVEKLPPTKPCKEAVSYIVRNHDIRGKFMPDRAKELKVKMGPDFSLLAKGESVVSEDGEVITPDMVLGPTRLGKGLAIIDLPTPEYVDALVSRSEWESPSVTTNLEAFMWILGPGVGDHPKLHEFVARMSQCTHTVASTDYCPNYLALASAAGSSVRMAQLRRDNFPVPVHDNVTLPQPGTSTIDREVAQIPAFQPLDPGLLINMEPKFELDRAEVMPRFNTSQIVEKMPFSVQQRMSTIRKRIKKAGFQKKLDAYRDGLPGADVEIIALGTGSSAPSKYRNVSSTLLHVPGSGYYLLDCGENTLGQLKRVLEPEKLREVLQNLRMIWISHLHADHHLGTATLIRAWFEENYPDGVPPSATIMSDMASILRQKRLFVVSEEMMIGWLEEYASVEDYGFSRIVPLAAKQDFDNGTFRTELLYRHCHHDGTFSANDSISESQPQITSLRLDDESSPLTPLLRSATGLSNLIATNVAHCRGAMAVTLAFPDDFKVSFSGDCRPSPVFAAAGQGSTVLIHEATFHNDMQGSAIAKKHSTIAEALEVGRQMNARSIFLTHFSQRYQKAHIDNKPNAPSKAQASAAAPVGEDPPDIPDNDDEVPSLEAVPPPPPPTTHPLTAPVVAAFDYMHVRVNDMPIAQAYAPAVSKLIEIFERQSVIEAEKQKAVLEKQLAAKQEEKAKRKNKHNKGGKAAAAAPPPVEPVAPAAEPEVAKKSPWSASESESGWETSGSER